MKNLLPFIFCGFSIGSYSQVNTVMPPEAGLFYNNAMLAIKPQLKNTIEKNANNLKGRRLDTDSLSGILRADEDLKNRPQQEIDAIAMLIMVQVSKNADAVLKSMVLNIQKDNEKNTHSGGSTPTDLDAILINKSQIASHISLLMNKLSGVQDVVIDHLK